MGDEIFLTPGATKDLLQILDFMFLCCLFWWWYYCTLRFHRFHGVLFCFIFMILRESILYWELCGGCY